MNPFVTMLNTTTPGAVFDQYTVKFHSATLLQTPVRNVAIDLAVKLRNNPEALADRISHEVESNALEAAILMRRGEMEKASALLALNMALITWMIEDSKLPAVQESDK